MPFKELKAAVRRLTPTQLDDDQAGQAVNEAYQAILRSRPNGGVWFGLWRSTTFCSAADKVAGTITLTQGSNVVTGIGTAFDAGDIGRYLVEGSRQPLRIQSVQSPTQFTLMQAWCEPALTNTPYQIVSLRYPLPPDGDRVIRLVGPTWMTVRRPLTMIDAYDPLRQQRGNPLIFNEVELVSGLIAGTSVPQNVIAFQLPVTAGSVTVAVPLTLTTASYVISLTTSWNTTADVRPGRTASGFIVDFGTPAPPGAVIDVTIHVQGPGGNTLSLATRVEIELWPVPNQIQVFYLQYRVRVPDLVGEMDTPVIAEEGVKFYAMAEQCRLMFSRTGDQSWYTLSEKFDALYATVLDHLWREDRRMRGAHPVVLDADDAVPLASSDPSYLQWFRMWNTLGLGSVAT